MNPCVQHSVSSLCPINCTEGNWQSTAFKSLPSGSVTPRRHRQDLPSGRTLVTIVIIYCAYTVYSHSRRKCYLIRWFYYIAPLLRRCQNCCILRYILLEFASFGVSLVLTTCFPFYQALNAATEKINTAYLYICG